MAGEKVLITGGAGFIGSHLSERLLAEGCEITAIDMLDDYYDPMLKRSNVARCEGKPGYRFFQIDITNSAQLEPLAGSKFDHIFHLAGRVGVRSSLTDPGAYIHHNIHGTQLMLEFARKTLTGNFLFASSSSVYGDRKDGPFKESDMTDHPETVYAGSKKAGELLCHSYHKLYNLNTICLRFFTVYGPRQRPDMAIAKFTRMIRASEPIPLYGDPQSARDYTYVADTVEGLSRAMQSNIPFGVYNLGCGNPVLLGEMVSSLGKALGIEPKIEYQPKASGDVFMTCADISQARQDFNYEPKVPFAEGVKRYVASLT